MISCEDAQIAKLEWDFPGWEFDHDSHDLAARRISDGKQRTARSANVLRAHITHAEFCDVLGEVLARSA